jgi:radical SAM protein with 4Fe4S-binding SPASM domain
MGNVRRKPLGEIFRDSELWDLLNDRRRRQGHCEVCTFKAYCGGCRARADAYFGRLHAGDPGCVFNAHHWDRLVAESPCRIEPNAAD